MPVGQGGRLGKACCIRLLLGKVWGRWKGRCWARPWELEGCMAKEEAARHDGKVVVRRKVR